MESTKHVLLHCTNLCVQRQTLFDKISDLNIDVSTKSEDYMKETLLLGQENSDDEINKAILEARIDLNYSN